MSSKLTSYILLLFAVLGSFQLSAQGTLVNDSAMFDGLMRNWIVFEPTNYDGSEAYPLVLNLHGAGSSATEQVIYSQFNTVADTVDALVLYPNAIANFWNSGFDDPTGLLPDDVLFLTSLIDSVKSWYNVDADRVYTMGMSNGGFMSYKLVCETSEVFAAMASVTGSMTASVFSNCDAGASAGQAVPVLQIHGTADSTVNYLGTPGAVAAQDDIISYWASRNNCPPVDAYDLPDISMTDGSTVDVQRYYFCDDFSEVIFYRVTNGGHTWPGSFPVILFGVTNQDIQAEFEIWKFFSRHSRNDQFTSIEESNQRTELNISPNPFSAQLVIELPSASASAYDVDIFDISGRLVYSDKHLASGEQLKIETGLETLEEGVYLLRLSNAAGLVLSKKVIKQL